MKDSALTSHSSLEGDMLALCHSKFRPRVVHQSLGQRSPDAAQRPTQDLLDWTHTGRVQE